MELPIRRGKNSIVVRCDFSVRRRYLRGWMPERPGQTSLKTSFKPCRPAYGAYCPCSQEIAAAWFNSAQRHAQTDLQLRSSPPPVEPTLRTVQTAGSILCRGRRILRVPRNFRAYGLKPIKKSEIIGRILGRVLNRMVRTLVWMLTPICIGEIWDKYCTE